jgi:PPK2 family polyphosphate:nucleotide phosphotransferase
MSSIKPQDLMVSPGISLRDISTEGETDLSGKDLEKKMKETAEKLGALQETLYAHNRYGVLVILQGMDTSGKDSLIREVFQNFNPRGVVVHSFKTPNSTELQYNYLWRHFNALPEKGKYAVFNRSHYENVLVTRVNPEYLLNENLPGIEKVEDVTEAFWQKRFEQINNFEKMLVENGTIIFKFFLHLSKDEQRKRLLRRMEKQEHNWKFNPGDIRERNLWDDYMHSYEEAINNTSTVNAPWYIIPADSKKLARYLVAEIIYEKMQSYSDIKEPEPDAEIKENMKLYIEKLKSGEI